MDFGVFEIVLELDRDFSPLRDKNFLQILVVVFPQQARKFHNFVVYERVCLDFVSIEFVVTWRAQIPFLVVFIRVI